MTGRYADPTSSTGGEERKNERSLISLIVILNVFNVDETSQIVTMNSVRLRESNRENELLPKRMYESFLKLFYF